jgi:eukaryotic-like serine/threonine-protein kinase
VDARREARGGEAKAESGAAATAATGSSASAGAAEALTSPSTSPFRDLVGSRLMSDATPSGSPQDVMIDHETFDHAPRSNVRPAPATRRESFDEHRATFLGRYVVEDAELLGQGGMGLVHACMDRRIGRQVALKTMRPERTSPASAVRFHREACVQAQLEHPSIVPVYDVGDARRGDGLYFTMKRVDGVTLREVLSRLWSGNAEAQRIFTRRKLLTAFVSVCHAVHYAHTRRVVHRDLKPVNIMLGSFGEVYVLDWGIARLLDAPDTVPDAMHGDVAGADPSVTGAGCSIGTLGYMSPEQARGERVDGRCDVHALGAILFELLTLQPFVRREDKQAMRIGTPISVESRPSLRAPQAGVPPELEAAIVRATAADPAARFESARDLGDAVERFLDGDRDLERRRELARAHVEAAGDALAERENSETRALVLGKLGQALALDPENAEAAGMLMRVLTSPPSEEPPEVAARIEGQRKKEQISALRRSAVAMLTVIAAAPIAMWMGVRSRLGLNIALVLAVLTIGVSLRGARRSPKPARAPYLPTIVLACATLSSASALFSPLFFMPTVLLAAVTIGMSRSDAKRAPIVIGIGLTALLAPLLLEWAGVLPPSFRMNGSELILLARSTWFPPAATLTMVITCNVAAFLIAALHIGRIRKELLGVQQKLEMQRWQLERLTPSS